MHEIHDVKDRSVLLMGVMDGHGGTAASTLVASEFPDLLTNQLLLSQRKEGRQTKKSVEEALTDTWETICMTYQQQCSSNGRSSKSNNKNKNNDDIDIDDDDDTCVADYDPREGILMANTGSKDLIAGTTASMLAIDEKLGKVTALNCGDSRSLIITTPTITTSATSTTKMTKKRNVKVLFATSDHTPQSEQKRIMDGIKEGYDYSMPQCQLSKWWIRVGQYEYSVGRSLEGPFASSKGIISDADVTTISLDTTSTSSSVGDGIDEDDDDDTVEGKSTRQEVTLISATDGIWEYMDSNEVARDLAKMRLQGMSARDAARAICAEALRKGSPDNVSAVVVYLR